MTGEKNVTRQVDKQVLSDQLHKGGNPLSRYKQKVLGQDKSWLRLFQMEVGQLLFTNLGGAAGYLCRRLFMRSLFRGCGCGLILGKNVTLRTPGNITIGEKVAIDDNTLLDGGTGAESSLRIGEKTVISKGCVVQAKTGPLDIGRECDIGAHVILSSVGGIELAPNVLIAGNCYIGGGRYNLDSRETPIMYQGIFSRGLIVIGEGTWIGASATILDGVKIGRGCVIGANSLVTGDIPDFSIALGSPARVVKTRNKANNP